MDAFLVVLIMVGVLGLYILPSLYAAYRQTSMMVVILVLNLLLGWTIVGWLAALALAVLLPPAPARQVARGAEPGGTPSDPVSTAMPGSMGPPNFLIDPMRVAAGSLIGPVWYQYWWLYRFFSFSRREGFPRSRSFLWIFVPFYCYVVIGRMLHDLDSRLGVRRPANFQPQAVLALIVAANASASVGLRFSSLPFIVGGLALSCVFLAIAFYQAQLAVNAYLRSAYPSVADSGVFPGEAIAVVVSLAIFGLLVLDGTRQADHRNPGAAGLAVVAPTVAPPIGATPSSVPTPTATPAPTGNYLLKLTSEPGDYIGQGRSATMTAPAWRLLPNFSNAPDSVTPSFETVDTTNFTRWTVWLGAPKGKALHVGTYANAERAAFRTGPTPGIDVFGDGRGCNHTYGSFTVSKVTMDQQGNVQSFEATFEQHCESPTAPALRGYVRFGTAASDQQARLDTQPLG